ncbi:MAG: uracil-DNA glycosylase [Gammaproteobacteria bacterium]|nr:uracil-DNA glycosylase [Gammaproteobacteria bacterium]
MDAAVFDEDCRACPRLAAFLDDVNGRYPDYYCRPVPPFGNANARFLIVGLAPGMHGANRTGRPFTGDHAGILLYQMLHKYGFSSADHSQSADDGLVLNDCRITNAVKCLPPENKPVGAEINRCNTFLESELKLMPRDSVVMALGGIAHRAIVKARSLRQVDYKFAHAAVHDLGDFKLLDSYHCSRYNTNTRRLTEAMFDRVFADVRKLLQI